MRLHNTTDFKDEDSSTTAHQRFEDVLDARLSRRGMLKGALGSAAAGQAASTAPGTHAATAEVNNPAQELNLCPANAGCGAGPRPRSATTVITPEVGGVIGT